MTPHHSADVARAAVALKGKARTKEALVEAIGRALDARGWFAHCGYPPRAQLPLELL